MQKKLHPSFFLSPCRCKGLLPVSGTFERKPRPGSFTGEHARPVTGRMISPPGGSLYGYSTAPVPCSGIPQRDWFFPAFRTIWFAGVIFFSEVFFSLISGYLSVPARRSFILKYRRESHGGTNGEFCPATNNRKPVFRSVMK